MNRAGEAKQLAALLNQVEELAELGRTAQDEDPSRGEPAARQLQDRYLAWYSAALGALPEGSSSPTPDSRGSCTTPFPSSSKATVAGSTR